MLHRIIRGISNALYTHPVVPQDVPAPGPFGHLKVALVADYFTTVCLAAQCRIRSLTPANYKEVISTWRPDLIFVESAFHGVGGEWRYMLAKQPKYIRLTRPQAVGRLVWLARDRGIPAVFWNKDDGAFFDAFLDVARLFAHVFTTDAACLERYKNALPETATAQVLAMPFQPAFHSFTGFHFERNEACFVGSYYQRILRQRRAYLDMLLDASNDTQLPVNIYDRNARRFSRHFEFRFPQRAHLRRHSNVPYEATANIYKTHAVSINVNSITDSETMVSRRLLEVLACGGILVTNPGRAVASHFSDFCHVVSTHEEATALFSRLKHGPTAHDKERAEAGSAYVHRHHTWKHRLEQLADELCL